jgi:hypothetical protein
MEQMQALAAGGPLSYVWTFAIALAHKQRGSLTYAPLLSLWRPVYVFVKGRMVRSRYPLFSDVFTHRPTHNSAGKEWHAWEQSLPAWKYWLERLTLPGDLVADPYCGSATIGVAIRDLGQRRYLGTDTYHKAIRTARARLAAPGG